MIAVEVEGEPTDEPTHATATLGFHAARVAYLIGEAGEVKGQVEPDHYCGRGVPARGLVGRRPQHRFEKLIQRVQSQRGVHRGGDFRLMGCGVGAERREVLSREVGRVEEPFLHAAQLGALTGRAVEAVGAERQPLGLVNACLGVEGEHGLWPRRHGPAGPRLGGRDALGVGADRDRQKRA